MRSLARRSNVRPPRRDLWGGPPSGAAGTGDDQEIRRGGERVYLHCNAGMNRAPTIAIAYLHVHHAMPLLEARDFVKTRRACLPYMTVLEARFAAK